MAITFKHIFDKSMFFLKKESKAFTSSDVKTTIGVDSFKRIAEEIGYPKSNYTVILTSGSWIISTPADFIKVDMNSDATYYNGTEIVNLQPREQKEIGRAEILDAEPSTPEAYFMESETKIGIYPPCTSGQVIIPYVKHPTSLSSDTDTNELTEKCYMASVYWTVSECLMKDEDPRASGFREMYNNEISRLKSQYNMMFDIRRSIKPHKDYLK